MDRPPLIGSMKGKPWLFLEMAVFKTVSLRIGMKSKSKSMISIPMLIGQKQQIRLLLADISWNWTGLPSVTVLRKKASRNQAFILRVLQNTLVSHVQSRNMNFPTIEELNP